MAESAATSITNDNDGDARSSAKFTRCRTGCLRCRKRRRKCEFDYAIYLLSRYLEKELAGVWSII